MHNHLLATSSAISEVVTAGDKEKFFGGQRAVLDAAGPDAHKIKYEGYHMWETDAAMAEACEAMIAVRLLVALLSNCLDLSQCNHGSYPPRHESDLLRSS